MQEARTKATELAVELLRGSVPDSMLSRALRGPENPGPAESSFDQSAQVLADRVGNLVKKLSLEIEKHIR